MHFKSGGKQISTISWCFYDFMLQICHSCGSFHFSRTLFSEWNGIFPASIFFAVHWRSLDTYLKIISELQQKGVVNHVHKAIHCFSEV